MFINTCVWVCSRGDASPDWGYRDSGRASLRWWHEQSPEGWDTAIMQRSVGRAFQGKGVDFSKNPEQDPLYMWYSCSRWTLWDTNESPRCGGCLVQSKSRTGGQVVRWSTTQGRQGTQGKSLLKMSPMRWDFLYVWHFFFKFDKSVQCRGKRSSKPAGLTTATFIEMD